MARSSFAASVWALWVACNASSANAEDLIFRCEWRESSPPYIVTFTVDLSNGVASRSDETSDWKVVEANGRAVWLVAENTLPDSYYVSVQTIERSPVGGQWIDTVLPADGAASVIAGGYCVELTQ